MSSIGTFAFMVKLFTLIRGISNDRLAVLEERIKLKDDTVSFVEREKSTLLSERDNLQKKLNLILNEEGLTIHQISQNPNTNLNSEVENNIQEILNKMEILQTKLHIETDAESYLSMAEGYYSKKEWEKAAIYFEKAASIFKDNWEIHLSKAISIANTRKSANSNIEALKAYNDAITYLPDSIDTHIKGRIYIYRGAMYKRLSRLEEAENDIQYGLTMTDRKYEVLDATYNLACIYAMKGNKEKMLMTIKLLKGEKRFIKGIKFQLNNYFKKYREDEDLKKLIG